MALLLLKQQRRKNKVVRTSVKGMGVALTHKEAMDFVEIFAKFCGVD